MENAILLFAAYGLLDSYFEDVMHYGFLFFAVFIGLCACYAATALAFCIMLLDDATSTQLLLLEAERPFNTPPPNNVAHAARILARTATACSVALFVLFLTVGSEFFTEDIAEDSMSAMALKKNITESALATQFAISTAFAVYFIVMLMLVGSNQQLNGIFLRLQYMTQGVPLSQADAAAYATTGDDIALFVRALLGLYVVICGSTGIFQENFILDVFAPPLPPAIGGNASAFPDDADLNAALGGDKRNYVALVFLGVCLVTDALRALLLTLPVWLGTSKWPWLIPALIIDLLQGFLGGVLAEVLFQDSSLTNFACAVLAICDATCAVLGGMLRLIQEVRAMASSGAEIQKEEEHNALSTDNKKVDVINQPSQPTPKAQLQREFSKATGFGLCFSDAHFNVDNIKMRVFEKKSN
jgi:hypothetical protein